MTFFEKELRRILDPIYPDAKYVGGAAYVSLDGDNTAKFKFITMGIADRYEALNASVVNRKIGVLDSTVIRFNDVFSQKEMVTGNVHAWTYDGRTEWYGFTPTKADYAALTAVVGDYASLFERPRMEQRGGMRQEQTM